MEGVDGTTPRGYPSPSHPWKTGQAVSGGDGPDLSNPGPHPLTIVSCPSSYVPTHTHMYAALCLTFSSELIIRTTLRAPATACLPALNARTSAPT